MRGKGREPGVRKGLRNLRAGLVIVRAHQHGDRGDHVRAALALDEPLHLGVVLGRTAEGVGAEDAHARHLLLEPLRPSVECAAAEVED